MQTSQIDESPGVLPRSIKLLRALAERSPVPVKLAELVVMCDLHKATCHRLLANLVAEGLVELTGAGYALGTQTWLLGRAADRRFDIAQFAMDSVQRIARETGDVGLLSVKAHHHVRCVGRVEGDQPILPAAIRVGTTAPLGCGAHGLALLSALPDQAVTDIIRETDDERLAMHPALSAKKLLLKVAETRTQGFALYDSELTAGMASVSLVIAAPWGEPIAALSCASLAERLRPDRRSWIVGLLQEEVMNIKRRYVL